MGVFVLRDGKVLLGERLGSHGSGTWALPGGHLEFGESIEHCAVREVAEETGLVVERVKKVAFTNDIFEAENKHYVTLFTQAERWTGEPRLMEPEKCRGWGWFRWNELPGPLFVPLVNLKAEGFVPEGAET